MKTENNKRSALATSIIAASALSGFLWFGGTTARADDCFDQMDSFTDCGDVWNFAADATCGCNGGGNVQSYTCKSATNYSFTCNY